jgi:MFS family permease
MIGLVVAGAAAVILAWRLVDLSLWSLIALLTLASFGVGTMLPISTVCVQNSVEIRNLGSATAVMQFVRQIGCALIVALLGALVMGDGASLDAARNIGGARHINGAAALEGIGASFHLVFIVIAICLGASLLFLVRMEEKPLRETPAAPRPARP